MQWCLLLNLPFGLLRKGIFQFFSNCHIDGLQFLRKALIFKGKIWQCRNSRRKFHWSSINHNWSKLDVRQVRKGPTCAHRGNAWLQPASSSEPLRSVSHPLENNAIVRSWNNACRVTFPWNSYLMEPSNSAPNDISFVTVPFISVTVKDRSEE